MIARALALVLLIAVVDGAAGCRRTYQRQACRMGNETVLARTRGVPFAVAVKSLGPGRFAAAWSADGSTYAMELDDSGVPRGGAERLEVGGEAAPLLPEAGLPKSFWPGEERPSVAAEDLSLVPLGDGVVALAMIERAEGRRAGGAYVTRISFPSGLATGVLRLGPAGEYASRISATMMDDRLIVAWHEGMIERSRVLLSRVGIDPFEVEETVLLERGSGVSNPSLARGEDRALLAWSRTVERPDETAAEIRFASIGADLVPGERATVASSRFLDPAPVLTEMPEGVGLVFRDDRDRDETPEFYFARVSRSGRVTLRPQRISQADGWRGPNLVYVEPFLVSTAIRSFQRNLLVGLNRFDSQGAKLGGEFQVYADKSDFVRVDLAESAGGMVMVYGEDRRGSGRILSGQVQCSVTR